MKLLVFKSRLPAFEPMNKQCRKEWLSQSKRRVGVDQSIVKYINNKYKGISVDYKDPFNVDLRKYDFFYIGLEYWSMAHVLQTQGVKGLKAYERLLKSIDSKKLIVPFDFIKFSYDKCEFNKMMKTVGIPVAPTLCVEITKKMNYADVFKSIKRKRWGTVFVKPIPGEESTDVFSYESNDFDTFERNVKHIVKKGMYSHLVCQKYMPNFATEKYPELRTFWVGDRYKLGVKTNGVGYYHGPIIRLPSVIREHTKRMITYFENKYKFNFVCARFDWGYDKELGYFVNEIELLPGFFNEEMEQNIPKCKWDLDAQIGDRLVKIIQEKA